MTTGDNTSAIEKKKRGVRAFRIQHKVRFPGGANFNASEYYETDSSKSIDLLTRCMEHTAYEVEVRDGGPAKVMNDRVLPSAPGEAAPVAEETDPKPDWAHQTKSVMRSWCDAAGATLIGKSASHAAHVDLCGMAWDSGFRARPLYGIPGGPKPGAGFSIGAKATDPEYVKAAIVEEEKLGREIPEETLAYLGDLVTGHEETEEVVVETVAPNTEPE